MQFIEFKKYTLPSLIWNYEIFAISFKVTELFTFENVRENQTEPPTALKVPEKELQVKKNNDSLKSNRKC